VSHQVLSIDLAMASYERIGFCVLDGVRSSSQARLLIPSDLKLNGKPEAVNFADAVFGYCLKNQIKVVLFDGPQGWKNPNSNLAYRHCERELFTPGKTGTEGNAKPRSFLNFSQFCIDVFSHLIKSKAEVVLGSPIKIPDTLLAVETFPTSAWRCMGQKPLAGKGKATKEDIELHASTLEEKFNLTIAGIANHDQIQAAIAGLAGFSILEGDTLGYCLSGSPPVNVNGTLCEGFIVNPRPTKWDKI
jgi:hypothetical protein